MAKSFAITTTATEPLRADAQGHAQAVFTVTNTTARAVRGLAKPKPLGDTKREWLSLEGEAERDFAARGTHQFTVNFDGPEAEPAGAESPADPSSAASESASSGPRKCSFRLDLESAQNPDEDFTEGPVVTVELMAPVVVSKKKFPLWILFVILGVLILIGVVVLIIVLATGGNGANDNQNASPTPVASASPTETPTPPASPSPTESAEDRCFRLVQGQIAWNYEGNKTWGVTNVRNLCRGTTDPTQPPKCFQRVMFGGINWGGGTQWQWQNALKLCAGTSDADRRISCFQKNIAQGNAWSAALAACTSE